MASVTFNQRLMQVHVSQPGATAVISGKWDGPPDSVFSLAGWSRGRKDALDAVWQIGQPKAGSSDDAPSAGVWDATVRIFGGDSGGTWDPYHPGSEAPLTRKVSITGGRRVRGEDRCLQ